MNGKYPHGYTPPSAFKDQPQEPGATERAREMLADSILEKAHSGWQALPPGPTLWRACTCFDDVSAKLKEKGYRIADGHSYLEIPDFKVTHCLPLVRADGSKLKKGDPKTVAISHCPFCGTSLKAPAPESEVPK